MEFNFLPVFDRTFAPIAQSRRSSVIPNFVRDEFQDPFGAPDDRVLVACARFALGRLRTKALPVLEVDHYVAMSAMQKAVRFGEADLAASASATLISTGGRAMNWKRIRTIAVEDVGAGDPDAAAFVLWLARQRDLHQQFGDLPLSRVALSLMCGAVKSRDMSDLHVWANLPGTAFDLVEGFVRESADRLVDIAADPAETIRVRYAAARSLFPAKFKGASTWTKHRQCERHRLYDKLRMPPAFAHMIEADVAFGGDALTSAGPAVWTMIAASAEISGRRDPLDQDDDEVIGGVLVASYDRYTRLGNRALAQLAADHPVFVDYFCRYPAAQPMECIKRALFYVEGGILRPRLSFDGGSDLYWSVLEAKFASTGIPSMNEGGWELLELLATKLPDITALRRQLLTD
jgi:hypothetical protein